jgi:hypothetical protein
VNRESNWATKCQDVRRLSQDEEGVNFKHAWADPQTGKVFCLSEAPNAEAVMRIHERAGHPTEHVFEVPVQA